MITVTVVLRSGAGVLADMSEAQALELVQVWSSGGWFNQVVALTHKGANDTAVTYVSYREIAAISCPIDTPASE